MSEDQSRAANVKSRQPPGRVTSLPGLSQPRRLSDLRLDPPAGILSRFLPTLRYTGWAREYFGSISATATTRRGREQHEVTGLDSPSEVF
jgi:hypothetical protein